MQRVDPGLHPVELLASEKSFLKEYRQEMSEMSPTHDAMGAPALLGTIDVLAPGSPGEAYTAAIPPAVRGEVTLIVECSAQGFPFEQYCRSVRWRDPSGPFTFSAMEFSRDPGGIRVGPWPGWRGIPRFPALSIRHESVEATVRETFWGDEILSSSVRYVSRIACNGGRALKLSTAHPLIIPKRVILYRTVALKAAHQDVFLREDLTGVHPRLLFTARDLPLLRRRARETHVVLWNKIAGLLHSWNLPFKKTTESKIPGGPERLSSEDRVLLSAFGAMMFPDEDRVSRALLAYSSYLAETAQPDFEPLRIDTQAGEVLFTLCLGYDWLVSFMSPAEEQAARLRIWEVADICFTHLGYERRDYGQAHYLGCGLGLLACSFLFWEDHPQAQEWAAWLRGTLECALQLVPDDGFYPHGINLWIYEFGFLLRWLEIVRTCTGEDLWPKHLGLEQASRFRAATVSPDGLYGVTFGDPQYRTGGDSWCHFLIAARTGSKEAQWVGRLLENLPHAGVDFRSIPARRRLYEFLFYDPAIDARPPESGYYHFPDGGQVCVRTENSVFTLRSGPPSGMHRYTQGEYGAYGHSDPAHGSFLVFSRGSFLANGSGPVYRRDTRLHNVVTIDGQGQIGDSSVWLPDFFPPETLARRPEVRKLGKRVDISVDLTSAYLRHLGVQHYRRALCVESDLFVAGVDIIRCDARRSLEWNAHSWEDFVPIPSKDPVLYSLGREIRLAVFAPQAASWSSALTEFVPAYANDGRRDFHLEGRVNSAAARFVWCYAFVPDLHPRLIDGTDDVFRLMLHDDVELSFDGHWLSSERQP